MRLSFSDIQQAKVRLAPLVKKTRLTSSAYFSQKLGINLFFKWENEQKIKSFKIRGALNKILSLTSKEQAQGLITASAGNHAQGVALAASYLNIKARVVMMKTASKVKVESTKKLGAEVILKGKNYDESYKYAQSIKGNSVFIHPFADSQIIAGQGTVGIEIFEELSHIDSVVVSVGGGGLLSGVSLALKSLKPSIKVYGVVWDGTPDFCRNFNRIKKEKVCLCKQKEMPFKAGKSGLTDGISVKKSLPQMVDLCSQNVDGIACVSEEEISKCIASVKTKEQTVVEGAGVASLAGLLKYHKIWDLGKSCCVVISGANIDEVIFSQTLKLYGDKSTSL